MPENRVDIRFTAPDVTSAQRLRFLKSGQFKVILIFWALSILFLAAHILFPQTFNMVNDASWPLVFNVTLIYAVTMLVLLYITPWMDFAINRFWRLPLELAYSEKQLRLTLAPEARAKTPKAGSAKTAKPAQGKGAKPKTAQAKGKSGAKPASGLFLEWKEINRVLENQRVFVIIYGPQSKFFVVPKSSFVQEGSEERFRELLRESKVPMN